MKHVIWNPPPPQLRRATSIVIASYFAIGLTDPNAGLWQLPLQWLLKEQFHLGAEEVAWFFAAALMPWYLKPVAGLLSDALPLFSSRRRAYLLVGAGSAAITSLAVVFVPSGRSWLLACAIGLHSALMLVSTVTGGFLVEAGQRWNATGRLTSWRSFAESAAALCSGPLGGWLASAHLGVSAGISVGLALSMFTIFAIHLRSETREVAGPHKVRSVIFAPIAALLRSRRVWLAAALLCCYQIAPGFQTPLFFIQTDTLHFTPRFIGTLALASAVGGLAGALIYACCCRRVAFRWLFPSALLIGVAATLGFLGYRSAPAALIIESCNGIAATIAFVALLDLIARTMPKGREALGYAFVFSMGNIASSASDILGSRWFDAGVTFPHLVWLNASTTALIIIAAPLLPKDLRPSFDSTNQSRASDES